VRSLLTTTRSYSQLFLLMRAVWHPTIATSFDGYVFKTLRIVCVLGSVWVAATGVSALALGTAVLLLNS
jgi:hypothetical protein